MERSQPLRVVLYKATGVGFFFFFFFFHFHFLFFFVFCFSVSWIWLMFRQCVHVWSWLVGGLFSFFLVSSFGVGYILFLSVQPAQNRRMMDVSNSLEETFHITADPTVSYLPLILHR